MAIEHEDTLAAPVDRTATIAARPAPAAGPELPAGLRLGHFQIVRKLGAGGMGEVYLATDLALDRPVALKVLPTGAATGRARERLIREARAQGRIQHPNVAHIYFIGEDEGRLYFAMEYVTGTTLAEATARGPLPPEDALAVIHAAVLGLREAQRSGFTHRDVKPSNLMRDAHGTVKLLDFGLVAGGSDDEAIGDGPVTQTTLAGTPLYMAPEQARGEPIDFRADMYALGATLYQLVSGKPPFQAATIELLLSLHASGERPTLPKGTVPRTQMTALDALIARMMAPRPEDRFASYDELLRAIENASTYFTRPAGFFVRSIAGGLDVIVTLIVVVIAATAILGDGNVRMGSLGPAILGTAEVLLVGRFGATLGCALFELEVVEASTGMRPRWPVALRRALWLYAPLLLVSSIGDVARSAGAPASVTSITDVVYGLIAVSMILRLAYASARVPGKRAPWDRRAGTVVRYRSGRRT